ncbi:MAG TPA: NADH-quinone oxidoreductase subunit NuoF, partial [Gemmatimonadales bacterium]|nr:NADH-quinone oxidoreductase subunit NuoF [Gemmatimonadales bacterium]
MGYPNPSHPKETVVLSKHFGDAGARSYAGWVERGGYAGLRKALGMTPEAVIEVIKASGLRGRGGAGFPTGLKWSFMPRNDGKPHYLVCNADESEPGTFKDREIMRWTPHALIEGCAVGAYAIGAETCYIYIRGEFTEPWKVMTDAVRDAYANGALGDNVFGTGRKIHVVLHRGAGAYICGEETALMNSIEGKRGNPRVKPPFPAAAGLFALPTTINNVETLAAAPHILVRGAEWYKGLCKGNPKSTGTKLISVCGHVQRPGNYEITMGTSMKELIYDMCGGMRPGRTLKAVIPGGSSVPLLDAGDVETCVMDYEGVVAAGSMLGSGGMIVMDDTTDIPY